MVELQPQYVPGLYTVDLREVPEDKRELCAANMAMVGEILADGQVTMEEAAQLLAMAYPDLAGTQLAPVLKAADVAVRAVRDDGKVSLPEALAILFALMAGVPSVRDLATTARAVATRMLGIRG